MSETVITIKHQDEPEPKADATQPKINGAAGRVLQIMDAVLKETRTDDRFLLIFKAAVQAEFGPLNL